MELKDFLKLLGRKKQTIFTITLVVLLVFLIFSFARPLDYRATSRLLIIQNFSSDAYTASKSTQFLGSTLAEVINSNSFLDQVLKSGYNLDRNIFSDNREKRNKEWNKMINVQASDDTGIIIINTYYPNKYQASQYNQAIAYTLVTKHNLYHGLGNRVSVKIIDETSTSNFPVRPNILLNSLLGITFGIVFSLFFVYLYPEKDIKFKFKKFKKHNNFSEKENKKEELEPEAPQTESERFFEGNIDNIKNHYHN